MTRSPLRTLTLAAAAGGIGGAVLGGLALLLGFGLPLGVWALSGLVIAVAWWGLHHLSQPAEPDAAPEPSAPPAPRSSRPDRRTRVLESQLRGAQSGRDMTVSALHHTVSQIARSRAGSGPYPPNLTLYLNAEPRALNRAHLRAILRELSTL